MLIKFILFLLIFMVIVLVHEGGHFIIGKRSGIHVEEFSIGLGPTIWGFMHNGTKYSIKLLPFGGLCMFEGLDMDDEDAEPGEGSFLKAPVWSRIATVAAGPIMNFVLAFFLSLFVISSVGYDAPVVYNVMEGYPAAEAGISAGDEILKIGSKRIEIYRDISLYMLLNEKKTVDITYRHEGQKHTVSVTPKYDESTGRYLFGLYGSGERKKGNVIDTVRYSLVEVRYWIEATWKGLGMIFAKRVTLDDVSGPVGVAQTVGEVYESSKSDGIYYIWLNMMELTILLTANLGVMNLLPIPALDGGRLVFLLIEALTKRKVGQNIEALVHFVGMCVLLVFMVFVMYNDITKLFK